MHILSILYDCFNKCLNSITVVLKGSLVPFPAIDAPISLLEANTALIFLHCRLILSVLELHINRIIQDLPSYI